ncbi:MAG: pilus assembly protein [Rhizobiaceae bacterium]|nr:pilus assembly protein [Rhizobiaceae bacterium]
MRIRTDNPIVKRCAKWFPKTIKRFETEEDGATAVEFALIAGPFFLLIFAILETSIMFFAGQYFETAVDDTARLLRTGQLGPGTTAAQFRAELCNRVTIILNCNDVTFDVQVAGTFDGLGDPPEPDPLTGDLPGDSIDNPGPDLIMQVSASYKWPIYTNFAAPLLHAPGGNYSLLRVTSVMRTEPY